MTNNRVTFWSAVMAFLVISGAIVFSQDGSQFKGELEKSAEEEVEVVENVKPDYDLAFGDVNWEWSGENKEVLGVTAKVFNHGGNSIQKDVFVRMNFGGWREKVVVLNGMLAKSEQEVFVKVDFGGEEGEGNEKVEVVMDLDGVGMIDERDEGNNEKKMEIERPVGK